MTRFTYIGAAYLALIHDEKILLLRRYNTGYEDGNYGLPAGHLDGGETAREGGAREVHEEIGIRIEPEDMDVVHVMHRKSITDERIDFFMIASRYEGEIRNCEPEKCDDLRWFPLDALPENTIDYIRMAIGHIRAGQTYSEYGWRLTASSRACGNIDRMARYGKRAQKKVETAMHEYKRGQLRSGRSGKKVWSRKQAVAIGLSQARALGAKVPPPPPKRARAKKSRSAG